MSDSKSAPKILTIEEEAELKKAEERKQRQEEIKKKKIEEQRELDQRLKNLDEQSSIYKCIK